MDTVLQKINKAGLKFLVPLTPLETYTKVVNEAIKLVNSDFGSLWLEDDGQLKRSYTSVPELYSVSPRKRGNLYKAFRHNQPSVRDAGSTAKAHPEFKKLGIQSIVHIPIADQNKPIGILVLYSIQDKHFSENELEILKVFGTMITLAIRKATLYDEIKKAVEVRDLFISMAAHELRTPLTSIYGYSELLLGKLGHQNTREARWVEELSSEIARMNNLVNELLAVNKIKSGQLDFFWKECHLKDIIRRAKHIFLLNHPNRRLILEDTLKRDQDLVIGDYDKLLQVITNLLDNASKFSPSKSPITIKLHYRNPDFIMEVKDQGQGIEKAEIEKVFDRFYKGHNNSLREGMGLGLSLVKHIITTHRGEIDMKSTLNKGTNVQVRLPGVEL